MKKKNNYILWFFFFFDAKWDRQRFFFFTFITIDTNSTTDDAIVAVKSKTLSELKKKLIHSVCESLPYFTLVHYYTKCRSFPGASNSKSFLTES